MRSAIYRCLAILLLIGAYVSSANAQATKESLTESELIAQVAGNSLSENIVHEITTRGLAFRPTDQYRALLTTAGGDVLVLTALKNAKISDRAERTEANGTGELLQHLATAGKLIRSKQYQEATEELNGALRSNGGSETGFVMGELLREQERWPEASAIYREVLRQTPDFTEAHTKLSFVLYSSGDQEEALREAKSALAVAP